MEISPEEIAARAQRFSHTAIAPTVKQRTFAHRDFDRSKMVISDAASRFRSLLLRKMAAGEVVSEVQLIAATAHGIDIDELREEAKQVLPSSMAPALYVEAGIFSKPGRRASSKKKAVAAPMQAARKTRRLSKAAEAAASVAAGIEIHDVSDIAPVLEAPAVVLPVPSSTDTEVSHGAIPGGPTERTTLQKARAALARIARLEMSLSAGDILAPGQLARIASKPQWEELAARLQKL